MKYVKNFNEINIHDIHLVGGKNASIGEMMRELKPKGINIPEGFAVTTEAFLKLLKEKNISENIYKKLDGLDVSDIAALEKVGKEIRHIILEMDIPLDIVQEIRMSYEKLCGECETEDVDVAVRSSATAEDLPEASFAGQLETFLNIRGEKALLDACLNTFASLFTNRAISYRVSKNIDHRKVLISIGVQQMVRSDLASSGVMFTIDPETGSNNVIIINSAYGLGENIVGGRIDPDEFIILKPLVSKVENPILRRKTGRKQLRLRYAQEGNEKTKNELVSTLDQEKLSLDDKDIILLSKWGILIEKYYSEIYKKLTPMDIEWAKDGYTNKLFILQARPETVHSIKPKNEIIQMRLEKKSKILLKGSAIGSKIGSGHVRIINDVRGLSHFKQGEILVADMTDPDWEPVMKKASGVVTNRGGRTCHAAIVGREHGVPSIVGTGHATNILKDGQEITLSCAEGEIGLVMEGKLPYSTHKINIKNIPKTKTKVMVNIGNPEEALKVAQLPVEGVGLARLEFIIAEHVKIHPMALIHIEEVLDEKIKEQIMFLIKGYEKDPKDYFLEKLSEGIGMIAGAFYPRSVIVRMSDFKTNEYSHLLGGEYFEPREENPMIGFRGASRYYHKDYQEGFSLECKALKYVREKIGLTNVKIMIPFCRTKREGELVINEMKKNGLIRGDKGLEVYMMCEIPSNVLEMSSFSELFDGFSIGSNDLTQMTLGVDRDSELLRHLFDERDPASLKMIGMAIQGAKRSGKPIGICGQAPSDFPEVIRFLIDQGIDSISLNPDSVLKGLHDIYEEEIKKKLTIKGF
jgi:pyruvate,water dikinase